MLHRIAGIIAILFFIVGPAHAGRGAVFVQSADCYTYDATGLVRLNAAGRVVYLNPTNNAGLPEAWVIATVQHVLDEWNAATTFDLFGPLEVDRYALIEGNEDNRDGRSEIGFQNASCPAGVRCLPYGARQFLNLNGKPSQRGIDEFSIILDGNYSWGTNGEPDRLDFENTLMRLVGWVTGLEYVWNLPGFEHCADVTMWWEAPPGEISKRTLEEGDRAGIRALYGD